MRRPRTSRPSKHRSINRRAEPLQVNVVMHSTGWIICAASLAMLSGCGYSTQRPFPQNVQTVYVEMFQNRDFRKDWEFPLSEAVIKRIEMDTDYRIASSSRADTIVSGEIVEIRQNTLGDDFRTDLPREIAVTFVVSFRWKDQRNGKILVERRRVSYTTTYIPPVGESFFDGATRGLEGVAEQLVEAMESTW